MAIIYTPGHNLITDSLIMHGIVRLYGDSVREIERIGEKYKIELIEDPKNKEALEILAEEAEIYADKSISKAFLGSSTILGKINISNINESPKVFPKWVSDIKNSIENFEPVTHLYTSEHKSKFKEERSRSSKLYTLHLPLSLIYGKYSQSDYKVIKDSYYRVCYNCFLFSNLGIIYGTSIVRTDKRTSEGTNSVVNILTLIPVEKVRGADVLLLQRFVEGKGIKLDVELTVLASLLYVLSIGETIYHVSFDVECLVWQLRRSERKIKKEINQKGKTEKANQRGLETISIKINDLLEIIARIKYEFDDFPKFIGLLARDEDGAYLLHQLAETLVFRHDVYPVIRNISTYLLDRYSKEEKIKCDDSQYCRYAKKVHILAEILSDILSKYRLPLSGIKENREFQKFTT